MKLSGLIFLLMSFSCLTSMGDAPVATPATPPANPAKFELYLLVGQSNMAGRGPLTAEDQQADPRILVLDREDKWVTEGEPIHFDKPAIAGVGPGYTFGKLLAGKRPGVTIGLIPCAFGGASLAQWSPTSTDKNIYPPDNLYQYAIRRTLIAMKSGTLKGILWHQGEADSDAEETADTYATNLAKLVTHFRTDLNAPYVPFIAGEIGYFNYPKGTFAQRVNEEIDKLPQLVPFCGVASAQDLNDMGDHLHFGNAAQKILAKRYLDAYLKVSEAATAAKLKAKVD